MAEEQLGNTSGKKWTAQELYGSPESYRPEELQNMGMTEGWQPVPGMSTQAEAWQKQQDAAAAKQRMIDEAKADAASQLVLGQGLAGQSIRAGYGLSPEVQNYEYEKRKRFAEQAQAAQAMQAPQVINPEVQASLQSAALGLGPSAAQAQLNQAQGQLLRDQMALAASARGSGASRYAAQQAAQENMSRMGGQFADQSAALRAQEMNAARGQYLQGAGLTGEMAMRQQDINRQREFGYMALEQQMYDQALARGMRASEAAAAARQGIMNLRAQQQESASNRTMGYVGAGLGAAGATLGIMAPWLFGAGKPAATRTTEAPDAGGFSGGNSVDERSRGIFF